MMETCYYMMINAQICLALSGFPLHLPVSQSVAVFFFNSWFDLIHWLPKSDVLVCLFSFCASIFTTVCLLPSWLILMHRCSDRFSGVHRVAFVRGQLLLNSLIGCPPRDLVVDRSHCPVHTPHPRLHATGSFYS